MQFPFEAISFDVALVSTEEVANSWAVFLLMVPGSAVPAFSLFFLSVEGVEFPLVLV